ncbi:F390 synthetase-related protein [Vibrio sp.]|uniref:F390 synthetase-related protein n=1 Tax=Vibrio sp. TaxID=678 RepID=UPI003F6B9E40
MKKLTALYSFLVGFYRAKRYQNASRQTIQRHQNTQLRQFKHKTLAHSQYYQPRLNHPLSEFPHINKKIHMENFNQINTANLDRDTALNIAIQSEQSRDFSSSYGDYSVGLSSGTSGNRGLFIVSQTECAEWAGYLMAKILPNYHQKHNIAFFLRANNNLYKTTQNKRVNFRYFDLMTDLGQHIEALESYQPSILIAPSSVLTRLIKLKPNIKPKKVVAVAEVLEETDKKLLSRYFDQPIHQVYQCTEGFLGISCHLGHLHLNEDNIIIEKHWIDKESRRFSPLITDLRRKTQPIVKYLLDDVLIEDPMPCPCGSHFTRIEAIEGRKDDVLRFHSKLAKEVDIFSDFVRNKIISACPQVEEYRVIQTYLDTLEVHCTPNTIETQQKLRDALNTLLQQYDIPEPNYQFHNYCHENNGTKRRRVVRTFK